MSALDLPPLLKDARDDLAAAFARPLLGAWPEDATFADADQPAALAQVLIARMHPHLINARIAYVYKESVSRRDRVVLGHMEKASAKIEYFAGFDFILCVNWETWAELSAEQRIALMDHELCHAGREDDETWVLNSHDVEEFGDIVTRWGLWKPDLATFGRICAQQQGDLFASPGGK